MPGGPKQRRVSGSIARFHVGACFEQRNDRGPHISSAGRFVAESPVRRQYQRCLPALVLSVDASAESQDEINKLRAACRGRFMKCGHALLVAREWIDARFDENLL